MNKCLFFFSLLLLGSILSYGQEYKLGVIPLPPGQFDKMAQQAPSLKGAAGNGTAGAGNCPSIVMLTAPPVGDQGIQGSCVGWGVGYTALGILTYPQYGNWNTTSQRSPSYVFNQIAAAACDGSNVEDALNLIRDQGSCSIASMPYNQNSCTTMPNSSQNSEASQNRSGPWSAIVRNDVDEIKTAICSGYPVVVVFSVHQSFYTL